MNKLLIISGIILTIAAAITAFIKLPVKQYSLQEVKK